MATPQHYAWAGGHFILLISALKYIISSVLFRGPSKWWYQLAYTGAIISYGIVCFKSLGTPQPNGTYLKRAMGDENVQYLVLALFWWSSKPIMPSLFPFAIFSLFHALTFTRTTLMPQFLPQGPPATAGGPPQPHPLAKRLQVWVKANYDTAMRLVAYTEMFIAARVIVGTILLQNSVLTPILYLHFVRMRYFQSAFTKEAFHRVVATIEGYVNKPETPAPVRQVWDLLCKGVMRWSSLTLPPRPAPAAAPPRGAAR